MFELNSNYMFFRKILAHYTSMLVGHTLIVCNVLIVAQFWKIEE